MGGDGCCALKTSYSISAALYSSFSHTHTHTRRLGFLLCYTVKRRRRDVVKSYYVWYLRNILERIEILFFYHFYGAMVGSRSRHSDDGRSNKSRIVKWQNHDRVISTCQMNNIDRSTSLCFCHHFTCRIIVGGETMREKRNLYRKKQKKKQKKTKKNLS